MSEGFSPRFSAEPAPKLIFSDTPASPVEVLDLAVLYPDRHPWLYIVQTFEEWEDKEQLRGGRRKVQKRGIKDSKEQAVWKRNSEHQECVLEKIAADLAQILQVDVPAGVLDRHQDGEIEFGSYRPAGALPFNLIREEKHEVFKHCYDCRMIAFDIWIDNWDKHPGNLVLTKQTQKLHSVDHGWICGYGYGDWHGNGCKWDNDGYQKPLFEIPPFPWPNSILTDAVEKAKVLNCAEDISKIPDNVIEYLVHRAVDFEGSPEVKILGNQIVTALKHRKSWVSQWINERIT